MNWQTMTAETKRIGNYLENRDWFINDELERTIDKANEQIAAIQKRTTKDIVAKLNRCKNEAEYATSDESLSARERQQSRTEARHIQKAIERIQ